MRIPTRTLLVAMIPALMVLCSCSADEPLSPNQALSRSALMDTETVDPSCWGQVSAVLAAMGEMGEHASQQSNPRAGLANLAKLLYDEGVLPDDSMASLGAYVADVYGLSIDACME